LETNNHTGNGEEITWVVENGGSRYVQHEESASSTVNVTVNSSFTGDMILNWVLFGAPIGMYHTYVDGTITFTEPWLNVNPDSGNCNHGVTDSLTVNFNAVDFNAGEYTANVIISSNDPDVPEVIVPVILNVSALDEFPGTALGFDGIDDYVIVNSNPELRPANNFTIEAWIKPDNTIDSQVIFMHDEDGGGNDGYALTIQNEHALFHAHNGSSQMITSDEKIVANCWNHIAAVYDNSVLRIYVNGIEKFHLNIAI
jgi:hypothetical protein